MQNDRKELCQLASVATAGKVGDCHKHVLGDVDGRQECLGHG